MSIQSQVYKHQQVRKDIMIAKDCQRFSIIIVTATKEKSAGFMHLLPRRGTENERDKVKGPYMKPNCAHPLTH